MIRFLFLALLAVIPSLGGDATYQGRRVHFTSHGKGGRTIVLLHCWTCDESFWTNQIAALSAKNRVITIDLPGHGQSEAADVYSQEGFAGAVDAVLQSVKARRAMIIGHSLGGITARTYARLFSSKTLAIVLVDPPMFKAPISDALRQFAETFAGANGPVARREFITSMFAPSTPAEVRQQVLSKMLLAPEAVAVGAMKSLLEDKVWDTTPLDIPVMLIVSGNSNTTKEPMRRLFPQLRFERIDGTGHFVMLEKPGALNELLVHFLDTFQNNTLTHAYN